MSTPASAPPSAAPPADPPGSQSPDADALRRWLASHVEGLEGPLTLQRFQGGQSNPTWRVTAASQSWVLRAKPGRQADLLPSAHAIEREFRVLKALQGSAVPVPGVRLLCEDESVIGAAFYLMDYVEGRIFRNAALPDLEPGTRAAVHDEANRVIAALHCVDWRAAGLQGFGREEGFFGRLIARWTRQYRASATTALPAMEQLIDWLPLHVPPHADSAEHTRLTHGDFRIENLMFHPQQPRVLAVLDWELSTLGHPLSDLAYHCMAWHLPPGPLQGFGGLDLPALGIPSEQDYIRRYCQRTGRQDMDQVLADWPFYLAFNCFRLTAILQGIARRVLDGNAASPTAVQTARMAGPVSELGWAIACGTN